MNADQLLAIYASRIQDLANPMSYQAYADALMGAPPDHLPA